MGKKTAYDREIGEFIKYTELKKGDKIAQFRIIEIQPSIEFEEVEHLGNADRGGFGSTGSK